MELNKFFLFLLVNGDCWKNKIIKISLINNLEFYLMGSKYLM